MTDLIVMQTYHLVTSIFMKSVPSSQMFFYDIQGRLSFFIRRGKNLKGEGVISIFLGGEKVKK